MARLPEVQREGLSPEHQANYDSIADSRGSVHGPFLMLMHSPDVAARIAHVGSYVRFEGQLDADVRELAIATAARVWDCRYEWAAHEPIGREVGVRPEAIAAIRDRTAPAGLNEREALVFNYVHSLLTTKRVPDGTFQAAHDWLGTEGVTELTVTAGYYSLLACTLDAFEVVPPADAPQLPV
jgi:4-carboxymuconolactone decarboxylase